VIAPVNHHRSPAGKQILVIGAGVSGLTSALCLSRRGFQVTVLADRFAPHVTSVVAGALWEWPPAVCGHHQDQESLARSKAWCETSYHEFADLAERPDTGVYLRPVTFYFKRPVQEDPRQREKKDEIRARVPQFRHDPALIQENGINPRLGLQDAYTHLAPMIDTDVYMAWLLAEVRLAGCRITHGKVDGPLRGQAERLARQFEVDAIVNCSGLGSREIAGEAVYPLRGALVRVRNDGTSIPRITQAHCISNNGAGTQRGFTFIVPRGDNMLVLGGLAEPDEWDLDIHLGNYEPVRQMYQRCLEVMPVLHGARIDAAEPVRVGLRPFRRQGVRLEAEADTPLVHNFGHGGSGVTLSWGCAFEVADLVEKVVGPTP
jgi:D-amino-acid oxidase